MYSRKNNKLLPERVFNQYSMLKFFILVFIFYLINDCIVFSQNSPRGLFILMRYKDLKDNKDSMHAVLSQKWVSGITMYLTWNNIEPVKNQINTELLNQITAQGIQAGKTINFGFLPARGSPEWIYNEGVKKISWTHARFLSGQGLPQTNSAPDPWDFKYWELYNKCIAKIGEILKPYSNIGYIAVCGPSPMNGIEANYSIGGRVWVPNENGKGMTATYPYKEEFENSGFEKIKFIDLWKKQFNVFNTVFPEKKLGLALHLEIGPNHDSEISDVIRDYIMSNYNGRCAFMLLGLGDKNGMIQKDSEYARLLGKGLVQDPNIDIGLQFAAWVNTQKNASGGMIGEWIENGTSVYGKNFRWVEVWYEDFQFAQTHADYINGFRKGYDILDNN
ncbi:MAG TPA: hypothetical protein DC049_03210 [Spirochaetia bacterium]|nr:hypothetical protein [Spirochaetia bacterium]